MLEGVSGIAGELLLANQVAFACPFCGLWAKAGYELCAGVPEQHKGFVVLHGLPFCPTFSEPDPTVYMAAVVDALRRRRGA